MTHVPQVEDAYFKSLNRKLYIMKTNKLKNRFTCIWIKQKNSITLKHAGKRKLPYITAFSPLYRKILSQATDFSTAFYWEKERTWKVFEILFSYRLSIKQSLYSWSDAVILIHKINTILQV